MTRCIRYLQSYLYLPWIGEAIFLYFFLLLNSKREQSSRHSTSLVGSPSSQILSGWTSAMCILNTVRCHSLSCVRSDLSIPLSQE